MREREKRGRALDAAMYGRYETWSEHGDAVAQVIFGAQTREEQQRLLVRFITHFDPSQYLKSRGLSEDPAPGQPKGVGVSDEDYQLIFGRIKMPIVEIVEAVFADDCPAGEFAERLLVFLEERNRREERAVIFGVLLQLEHLLPYESLPKRFTRHLLRSEHFSKMSEREGELLGRSRLRVQKIVQYYLHGQGVSLFFLATALQRLMAGHRTREQQILMGDAVLALRRHFEEPEPAESVSGSTDRMSCLDWLGVSLLDVLEQVLTKDCEDPDCLLHQRLRELRSAKSPDPLKN
ncbi:hypothetical protein HY628_01505 [Candidatus Uhrbacteria bacterium]|nr:hypothetical protein [Candidatus Uhrbacteria bacterium]